MKKNEEGYQRRKRKRKIRIKKKGKRKERNNETMITAQGASRLFKSLDTMKVIE